MSSRFPPRNLLVFRLTVLLLLAGVGTLAQASEKYVGAAYFEKHNKLIDSDFEDFIWNELVVPADTGNGIAVRLSGLGRDLIGQGSHRRLSSSIQIQLDIRRRRQWEIVVFERLPSGVFADPFELQRLVSRGEFSEAAVFGDTNLELPSLASNPSLVELHMEIEHNVSSRKLEVGVKLPLHARYAPLVEKEEEENGLSGRRIELKGPDVFIRTRMVDDDGDAGRWWLYPLNLRRVRGSNGGDEQRERGSVVTWEVPSGIKSHTFFVSLTTFTAALLSAFLIVLTSIRY